MDLSQDYDDDHGLQSMGRWKDPDESIVPPSGVKKTYTPGEIAQLEDARDDREKAEFYWHKDPNRRPLPTRIYTEDERTKYQKFNEILSNEGYEPPPISVWIVAYDMAREAEAERVREVERVVRLEAERQRAREEQAAREREEEEKQERIRQNECEFEEKQREAQASAAERRAARNAECTPLPERVFAVLIRPHGVDDVRQQYQKAIRDAELMQIKGGASRALRQQWEKLEELRCDIRDATKSLGPIEGFLQKLGARVIRSYQGRDGEPVSALLAIAAWPLESDLPDVTRGSLLLDLCDGLGCYCDCLTVGDLKPLPGSGTGQGSLVEVSDKDYREPDSEDPSDRSPACLTWRFEVPQNFTVLSGADPTALLDNLPAIRIPCAEIEVVGELTNWDREKMLALLSRKLRKGGPAPIPEVVIGLLPRGQLVLFAGDGGEGKSSIAHQIAMAVAGQQTEVLGYPIDTPGGNGVAVFLSGEDNEVLLEARAERMAAAGLDGHVMLLEDRFDGDIEAALEYLDDLPSVGVLVVDGTDYWFKGNDKEKSDVNPFLHLLMAFAHRTGACVLLIHHVTKPTNGVRGGGIESLRPRISGGPMWVNRSRVVLTLSRDKRTGGSRFGVVKTNLAPQIQNHEVALRFDEATGLHYRAGMTAPSIGDQSPAQVVTHNDVTIVVNAVADLRGAGQVVQRTGKKSLYQRKAPQLADWSRARIDHAVGEALRAGELRHGGDGLVPVSDALA